MPLHHNIEIQLDIQPIDVSVAQLEKAILATLKHQQATESCEIILVLSDDSTIQDLNLRFRGLNRPTDVLSFNNDNDGPFSTPSGSPRYLGDIVISVERAQAQAAAVSATLIQELQLLAVHGVLHLLGYDHATVTEKTQMWAAQDAILQLLGIHIPLPE